MLPSVRAASNASDMMSSKASSQFLLVVVSTASDTASKNISSESFMSGLLSNGSVVSMGLSTKSMTLLVVVGNALSTFPSEGFHQY
jgi:hypothetical protein